MNIFSNGGLAQFIFDLIALYLIFRLEKTVAEQSKDIKKLKNINLD